MTKLHSWIESIWWQAEQPPLYLRLLEPLYAAISARHLSNRSTRISTPALPMISVGNITVGGSGKTPFVLWLADQLKRHGKKPVILCRGDGGSSQSAMLITAAHKADEVGDEARLLADLSACPVIAAQDRISGSMMAASLGDILILDDGFQYRHLDRCCDIVLIPETGVGNGHQLPAGPLREPMYELVRADLIVRTGNHSSRAEPVSIRDEWQWHCRAGQPQDVSTGQEKIPESFYAATAIARPRRFFDDLTAMDYKLTETITFPDHHAFTASEVTSLLAQNQAVVVTAKDAVKLKPLWPADLPLWVLPLESEAEEGLFEAILAYIPKEEHQQ